MKMVFGVGENTSSVLFPGIVPSQPKMGADVVQGALPGLPSGGETFVVVITNTDSTSPTIVPKQIGGVIIQSDTTLSFSVNLPQAIVYLDSTQQIIRGFGAANIAGSVNGVTPSQVPTAFGTGVGQLGLTIMRVPIPPDSTQFILDVPSAQTAESLGVTIIASPWTPPAWMKTNDNVVGGSLNLGAYPAYAAYLKAFVDTMSSNGVSLYAISVQNEPDASVTYWSCSWNATQLVDFMKNFAPTLGVPVFMPESESFNHQLSDPTLNDSVAASDVAFIAGHIYGVSPSSYPLALEKGKELWMTEHYTSTDPGNNWPKAVPVGKEINDCMNADMSAYVWWYIVADWGPLDQNGVPTKRGYVMSQYAKFVRPGFYRVSATSSPLSNLYVTAYKDGTKAVIVVLNMGSVSLTLPFSLQGGTAGSFTPYVTSNTKNCVKGSDVSVSGNTFTATLEPSSVTTFVSN
jgi:glucuronoarabinoxylan endo-1,4-beta-xylanase